MVSSITPGARQSANAPVQEDNDSLIQGLTPEEIKVLAQKVYDLLLEEMRIELERHGSIRSR